MPRSARPPWADRLATGQSLARARSGYRVNPTACRSVDAISRKQIKTRRLDARTLSANRRSDRARVGPRPASRESSRRLHTEYNTRDPPGPERCKTEGRPISAESPFRRTLQVDASAQPRGPLPSSRILREIPAYVEFFLRAIRSTGDRAMTRMVGDPFPARCGNAMLVTTCIRDLTGMCRGRTIEAAGPFA